MNRLTVRNHATLEKAPVALFLKAAIGATGAPTINALQSKGFISITRLGVGNYKLSLGSAAGVDTYQRLMMAQSVIVGASSTAFQMVVTQDNSATLSAPNVQIKFFDAAGAAVELPNGVTLLVELILSNTTAN